MSEVIPQPLVLTLGDQVNLINADGTKTPGTIFGCIADVEGLQYIIYGEDTGRWLRRCDFEFVAPASAATLDDLFARIAADASAGGVTALPPNWRAELSILQPAPVDVPMKGTVWEHYNKKATYEIVNIANFHSTDQARYPTTVVYRGLDNMRLWSRPLWDWHRSMTKVDDATT